MSLLGKRTEGFHFEARRGVLRLLLLLLLLRDTWGRAFLMLILRDESNMPMFPQDNDAK